MDPGIGTAVRESGIGAHRIDRLEPEHLEKLYRKMVKAGAKPGRAHQVHRTIRAALTNTFEQPGFSYRSDRLDAIRWGWFKPRRRR